MLSIKFLILTVIILIGYSLGYLLTETKYYISKYRLFQFKAFECRKCLSFHISWFLSTFIGLLFNDWGMVIVGIAFAVMLFIGLYIDEKIKTENV